MSNNLQPQWLGAKSKVWFTAIVVDLVTQPACIAQSDIADGGIFCIEMWPLVDWKSYTLAIIDSLWHWCGFSDTTLMQRPDPSSHPNSDDLIFFVPHYQLIGLCPDSFTLTPSGKLVWIIETTLVLLYPLHVQHGFQSCWDLTPAAPPACNRSQISACTALKFLLILAK